MKKAMQHYRLILFVFIMTSLAACRKERDLSYQGPTVVEFSNPVTGTNAKTMGPTIGGGSLLGDNPSVPIKGDIDSVLIQLVGPQRNVAVDVSYEIEEGSAMEGVDFEIIGEKGKATIVPNTSSTAIYLRLLNQSTDPSAVKTLSFRITGTNQTDVTPSTNYSTFSLSIFPMKVYLDRVLDDTHKFLSLVDGNTYLGNADMPLDIQFTSGTNPRLSSPTSRTTRFSQRVFIPGSDVPDYLLNSYVTLQLNNVNSISIAAIPESGTSASAVTSPSEAIVSNGVYGFKTTEGKKGYLRVKELENDHRCVLDIMVQP